MNISLGDHAVKGRSNLQVALNFRERSQGRLRGFLTLSRCIQTGTICFHRPLRHFQVIAGDDAGRSGGGFQSFVGALFRREFRFGFGTLGDGCLEFRLRLPRAARQFQERPAEPCSCPFFTIDPRSTPIQSTNDVSLGYTATAS